MRRANKTVLAHWLARIILHYTQVFGLPRLNIVLLAAKITERFWCTLEPRIFWLDHRGNCLMKKWTAIYLGPWWRGCGQLPQPITTAGGDANLSAAGIMVENGTVLETLQKAPQGCSDRYSPVGWTTAVHMGRS